MTIIYAILMFTFLIFIHELGHFLAAKACGVKVNDFAIGMGPSIFKKQKGETTYHIKAFPIGGFCAMEGEDEESDDQRAFNNKKSWQKAIIVIAGPLMNLVIAIVLITIVIYIMGVSTTVVDKVMEDSPALKAGMLEGDKIVKIEDRKIKNWEDVGATISDEGTEKETLNFQVERNGNIENIEIEPKELEEGRLMIGVIPKTKKNLGLAISQGPKATWAMTKNMLGLLKQLVTGKLAAKNLSGPVGIVYFVDQSAKAGIISFLSLMALISLNLAVFNLLPFPALDGGRLLFIIIRKFTGGIISDKVEGMVHGLGLILLLSLTVYVTWHDIVRFIVPLFK